MYAVVNSGGKQYKVQQGEVLRVEKIAGDVGSPVTFDRVLLFSDGENVSIGQPVLDSVLVEGHIVEQGKAKKIIVFKYKRRKRYRRKSGHRQEFTAVRIDTIKAKGAKAPKTEPKTEAKAVVEEPAAKKAAPSKETAKKAETKKAAPKKEPAKKAEAKKAKAVPKKEPAKKAETKKEPAKKAETKKETAKKAGTKKAAPKKETAKKAPAKKAAAKKEDKK
jgi:large subunit ribosomal protein L21